MPPGSRKRRRSEQAHAISVSAPSSDVSAPSNGGSAPANGGSAPASDLSRGYARSRRRDDDVRASLEPLAPGERPLAVTIGALAALGLAIANVVALIVRYDPDQPSKTSGTIIATVILLLVAFGMWRAKYWAVLGMQALLALTIIGAAVGSLTALNENAVILVVAILVPSVTLFWFLVKAMARIQMPARPGQEPR